MKEGDISKKAISALKCVLHQNVRGLLCRLDFKLFFFPVAGRAPQELFQTGSACRPEHHQQ